MGLRKIHSLSVNACFHCTTKASPILPDRDALKKVGKKESDGPSYNDGNQTIRHQREFIAIEDPAVLL